MGKLSQGRDLPSIFMAGPITTPNWRWDLMPDMRPGGEVTAQERRRMRLSRWRLTTPFPADSSFFSQALDPQTEEDLDLYGAATPEGYRRSMRRLTRLTIDDCSFVFAWIDSPDCAEAIYQLGYAKALAKPSFVAIKAANSGQILSSEVVEALEQAEKWVETSDHHEAWTAFHQWLERRVSIGERRQPRRSSTRKQLDQLEALIDEVNELERAPLDQFQALDFATTNAIIRCLETGGDPTIDFPELFAWNTDDHDDANSGRPVGLRRWPDRLES